MDIIDNDRRGTVTDTAGVRPGSWVAADIHKLTGSGETRRILDRSLISGGVAALSVCSAIALLGRSDSGSAIAPINASSHVIWGRRAGQVDKINLAQTLPGLAINVGASFWWASVCEGLFGRRIDQGGVGSAMAAGLGTAVLAYILDYRIVPRRLSPGWELRLSDRSVLTGLGAMGIGLGVGALLARR